MFLPFGRRDARSHFLTRSLGSYRWSKFYSTPQVYILRFIISIERALKVVVPHCFDTNQGPRGRIRALLVSPSRSTNKSTSAILLGKIWIGEEKPVQHSPEGRCPHTFPSRARNVSEHARASHTRSVLRVADPRRSLVMRRHLRQFFRTLVRPKPNNQESCVYSNMSVESFSRFA
jgi:hypothetical protein